MPPNSLTPQPVSDHFSPKGHAALDEIKAFIKSHASSDALDERAFILAGLPHDEITEGVEHFCNELVAAFAESGLPANLLLDGEK